MNLRQYLEIKILKMRADVAAYKARELFPPGAMPYAAVPLEEYAQDCYYLEPTRYQP